MAVHWLVKNQAKVFVWPFLGAWLFGDGASARSSEGKMLNPAPCNVLMIYPRFSAGSFWNYSVTAELLGARYPTIPLGLITLAALLPREWMIRLVNRNTETVTDADFDWADLVMTGGMLFQQADSLQLITLAHAHGKPIAIGGPDATASPHIYADADFLVLGEAEGIVDKFIAAWEAGARTGSFRAPKYQVDVSKSPIPRFDLLKFKDYLFMGVQFSRGCPFTCEFCDIIELYGRVPRTKTTPQMLAELDTLYALGYRGHVDFVDDNLIGNKKAVRAFLPHLKAWQEEHNFPFEFSTEASVNLADDHQLLALMRECGFFTVFVGIESPDPYTLVAMKKKQNTRRSLVESVHQIYEAGLFVSAGFILGFDSETGSVARPMADFIEEAAIPVAMVGLLYALPTTQLTRRLISEHRLYEGYDSHPEGTGDQCVRGLNYETARPRREILDDYRQVLSRIYDPPVFCARVERLIGRLKCNARPQQYSTDDLRRGHGIETIQRMVKWFPEWRDLLWRTFLRCYEINPGAVRQTVMLLALFLHLGPYARQIITETEKSIADIDSGASCARAFVAAAPLGQASTVT
jgi:radical SAM superfamily enzyme YgiQ (UPF0313 family)